MSQIQWFPGHMAKTFKELEQRIKFVDLVIELVDARAPLSSRNPQIGDITSRKPTLIILTKSDLASDRDTKAWLNYYKKENNDALAMNLINEFNYNKIKNAANKLLEAKFLKDEARGIRRRPIKALIVGIPNVGKSTFINQMAKRKATRVENRPGVTRSLQWIKVQEDFELLDTPGLLWPSFEDKIIGVKLALIGTIRESILPKEQLCFELLKFLSTYYLDNLNTRYQVELAKIIDQDGFLKAINKIGEKRGFLLKGGEVDKDRVIPLLLTEFHGGLLGRISLEKVNENLWEI